MNFVRFDAPNHPVLMTFQDAINGEAEIAKIPPCLLAAIVWRESGGQNILQEGVPPGPECGVGLTQITAGVDWSNPSAPTFQGYPLLNCADNLYVAAAFFLAPLISQAARAQRDTPSAFETACRGQIIYAVACGYNAGWGKVRRAMAEGVDCDSFTSNNYAKDVLGKYALLVDESTAASKAGGS